MTDEHKPEIQPKADPVDQNKPIGEHVNCRSFIVRDGDLDDSEAKERLIKEFAQWLERVMRE